MATNRHSPKIHSGFKVETLETTQNDRLESAFLIDLRKHRRFNTLFPGEAFATSGEHLHVTITNVSLSGLRLEGSRQTVDALLANLNGHTPDTDLHTSFEVRFSVPTTSDHLAPVKVHCSVVQTQRAEKDTFQIGMKFVNFEEGRAALVDYLRYREAAR